MAFLQKLTLFLLLIVFLVKTGYAIKCYSCSTHTDSRCGDEFIVPNGEAKECLGTCYKYRGERWSDSVRYVEVNRGCRQQQEEYCEDTKYNGIAVKGCYCNQNYCNSGVGVSSSILTLTTFFFIYYLLF